MTTRDTAAASVIVRNPAILDGEPTVTGTRVPVRAIVLTSRYAPDTQYLLEAYPMLTAETVQAALDYYDQHQAEIDQYIAENEADSD